MLSEFVDAARLLPAARPVRLYLSRFGFGFLLPLAGVDLACGSCELDFLAVLKWLPLLPRLLLLLFGPRFQLLLAGCEGLAHRETLSVVEEAIVENDLLAFAESALIVETEAKFAHYFR